jgi:hypothetical protein
MKSVPSPEAILVVMWSMARKFVMRRKPRIRQLKFCGMNYKI